MTKVKIYVKKNNTSGKEKLEIKSKTDDDGSHIFELKDVKESDEGEYNCKVKNKLWINGESGTVTLKPKGQ